MSLRIILKPDQISKWITDRNGHPVRDGKAFRIAFEPTADALSIDDLLDEMKNGRLVMLVDQEPGKTFHKIYAHS
jgi:hypothetical protein